MPVSDSSSIEIGPGTTVTLHFSLALESGEIIDSNFQASPATFQMGDGNMLPGFEEVLLGLKAGEEVERLLQPEQAFGTINSENRHTFPRSQFAEIFKDELIPTKVGSVVAFKDPAGLDLPGVITDIGAQLVSVDFNHPLAGKAILFRAMIISVFSADTKAVEIKL